MVQTGGSMDSRSYKSIDSSHVIQGESGEPKEDREKAILNFEKVKDELTEEESPNPGFIKKWLGKAQSFLKNIELAKSTVLKAKELYDLFGLPYIF